MQIFLDKSNQDKACVDVCVASGDLCLCCERELYKYLERLDELPITVKWACPHFDSMAVIRIKNIEDN